MSQSPDIDFEALGLTHEEYLELLNCPDALKQVINQFNSSKQNSPEQLNKSISNLKKQPHKAFKDEEEEKLEDVKLQAKQEKENEEYIRALMKEEQKQNEILPDPRSQLNPRQTRKLFVLSRGSGRFHVIQRGPRSRRNAVQRPKPKSSKINRNSKKKQNQKQKKSPQRRKAREGRPGRKLKNRKGRLWRKVNRIKRKPVDSEEKKIEIVPDVRSDQQVVEPELVELFERQSEEPIYKETKIAEIEHENSRIRTFETLEIKQKEACPKKAEVPKFKLGKSLRKKAKKLKAKCNIF